MTKIDWKLSQLIPHFSGIGFFLLLLLSGCWQPTENNFSPEITTSAHFQTDESIQFVYLNVTHPIDAPVKPWWEYPEQLMPGLSGATVFLHDTLETLVFSPDSSRMSYPGYYSAQFVPKPGKDYSLRIAAASLPSLERCFKIPGAFQIINPAANDTVWLGTRFEVSWTPSQNALAYSCEFSSMAGFSIIGQDCVQPHLIIENFGVSEQGGFVPSLYNQPFRLAIRAYWKSNPNLELGEMMGSHVVTRQFFAKK